MTLGDVCFLLSTFLNLYLYVAFLDLGIFLFPEDRVTSRCTVSQCFVPLRVLCPTMIYL